MVKCMKCHKDLDASCFQKNNAKRDGLQEYCRDCNNAYNRERYYKNHEYELARSQNYRDNHPNFLKEYGIKNRDRILAQKRDYYQSHKEESKAWKKRYFATKHGREIVRKSNSKHKYGLKWIRILPNIFEDCRIHYHHVNDMLVVPLPEKIHMHNLHGDHRGKCNSVINDFYGIDMDVVLHV